MLELWGMRSTLLLPSLPGPFLSAVVNTIGFYLWVELNGLPFKMNTIELLEIELFDHFTVCKKTIDVLIELFVIDSNS